MRIKVKVLDDKVLLLKHLGLERFQHLAGLGFTMQHLTYAKLVLVVHTATAWSSQDKKMYVRMCQIMQITDSVNLPFDKDYK